MNAQHFVLTLAAAGFLATGGSPLRAEDNQEVAMLAAAMQQATVTLAQGLKASEARGTPISGKFEIEGGSLQLSVYTAKDGKYTEVVIDHRSGSISKAEAITETDDLKDAAAQSRAMDKARTPLEKAVKDAVAANPGYRAVSIVPVAQSSAVSAEITLMNRESVKRVSKRLN